MPIPALSSQDLEHAASIVHRVYTNNFVNDQQQAQRELFDLQQRVEAWNIIIPFLQHDDPNLQFIGAHTAQVKISRDWETLPTEDIELFQQSLFNMIGFAAGSGRSKVILRKLYVALISLALKLSSNSPSPWPDWVTDSTNKLSALGLSSEYLLDFLTIVAQEASRSDLTGIAKSQLNRDMRSGVDRMIRLVEPALLDKTRPVSEKTAALSCFEAWIYQLSGGELSSLIPPLTDSLSQTDTFVATTDVLCEILGASSLASGAGTKILTEPLLFWIGQEGRLIYESSVETESIDEISRAFCKLIVTLGDHSLVYLVKNINEPLVQNFLQIMMGYTGFPGYFGVDEDESEVTISFWVYFGEAVLDSEAYGVDSDPRMRTTEDILLKLVKCLKEKCRFPPAEVLLSWNKDQIETFAGYRRDLGEAILNAYYVLRANALKTLAEPVLESLRSANTSSVDWEDVEASLHCIGCLQDGVPVTENVHLEGLVECLSRIPTTGHRRLRQTTLNVVGDYATWFAEQRTPLLLNSVSFVVSNLHDQYLCHYAANALRLLCDANRVKLAPHIASFAEIHSASSKIPYAERAKVVESIASVIEALPPAEGVAPTLAIIVPMIEEWSEALGGAGQFPEEARSVVEKQLRLLSSCSKGLSPQQDTFTYDDPATPEGKSRTLDMSSARNSHLLDESRQRIVTLLRGTMELWSVDPEISDAISDLIKAITTLPLEATLLSLPPAPLLELTCIAADRQLTAVWLNLAARLVVQLEPSSFISLKTEPEDMTRQLVTQAAQSIIVSSLRVLQSPTVMNDNPDLVQAFFSCVESITHSFIRSIMLMPADLCEALLVTATQAILLQERYSLVAACKFLVTFVKRSTSDDTTHDGALALLTSHGQRIVNALVYGIASDAPRSAIPNLASVMSIIVSKLPAESRVWLQLAMQSEHVTTNPRITPSSRDAFLKTITASRSTHRTLTASNDFALVARGLSSTSYAAGQVL